MVINYLIIKVIFIENLNNNRKFLNISGLIYITTSSIGMTPANLSVGVMENLMVGVRPIFDSGPLLTNQRKYVPMSADPSTEAQISEGSLTNR